MTNRNKQIFRKCLFPKFLYIDVKSENYKEGQKSRAKNHYFIGINFRKIKSTQNLSNLSFFELLIREIVSKNVREILTSRNLTRTKYLPTLLHYNFYAIKKEIQIS